MKDPEQALAAARRAAAQLEGERSPGGAQDDREGAPWSLEHSWVSSRRLAEWAIIEPEHGEVYSTRRFGRPITVLKRLLIRLLSQYLGQMSAQQSRFNAHVAAHVMRLEERIQALEDAAGRDQAPPGEQPPR